MKLIAAFKSTKFKTCKEWVQKFKELDDEIKKLGTSRDDVLSSWKQQYVKLANTMQTSNVCKDKQTTWKGLYDSINSHINNGNIDKIKIKTKKK